jgi:hypothetical protein
MPLAAPRTTDRPLNARRYHAARGHAAFALLWDLRRAGLPDEAVPHAARLIVGLEEEARVLRELAATRLVADATITTGPLMGDRSRATAGLRDTYPQEDTMPATKTAPKVATRKADPEAAALADAARELARAAGLKSAYTAGEGREVLDRFTVDKARGALAISKDTADPVRIKADVLRAFVAGEKTDDTPAVAKQMAELASGTKGMLYGRKLGAFLLARAA